MSSLSEESNFSKLKTYYEDNKNRPWYDWLEVKEIFPRPGKQGLVGLMVSKDHPELVYVFKISQYINYLVQHELSVMKSLNELGDYCPNFCKAVGGILCEVDPVSRKKGNPFISNSPYLVEKEVMLMEYLDNTHKFYNYIKSSRSNDSVVFSIIKQTLLAVAVAQQKKKFTHYDLHSNNIMMKRCSKNLVFLYVMDDGNQFCISTNGYYPVIIDFGFSYSQDLENGPLWPSLDHTEIGFISDRMDPIADPKLFLVSVSDELMEFKKSKKSKKLRNIVRNSFEKLPIAWDNGWDKYSDKSVTDALLDVLCEHYGSNFFNEYIHYCIEILQTLIILPLQKQDYSNIQIAYKTFVKEFIKIENEISSPFYCIYILKGIVDSARTVAIDYRNKETRKHSIDYFKLAIRERVDSVAKYCKLKGIHYEKMLCSLLCLGKNIEGILYKKMTKTVKRKSKQYKKIPFTDIKQLYSVIDYNIADDYVFNEKTVVMVVDCIKEECVIKPVNEDIINEMNILPSISRGPQLYKML